MISGRYCPDTKHIHNSRVVRTKALQNWKISVKALTK